MGGVPCPAHSTSYPLLVVPSQLFEARCNDFSLGLDLRSQKNLKYGQISGARSVRYEKGAGIMTGAGFRVSATPVADVRVDGMKENTVYSSLWIKTGTKVQYSEDAVTFYDTGVTVTADRITAMVMQGNGDMMVSNNIDTPLSYAVARLAVAITSSSTEIDLGTSTERAKFSSVNPST